MGDDIDFLSVGGDETLCLFETEYTERGHIIELWRNRL